MRVQNFRVFSKTPIFISALGRIDLLEKEEKLFFEMKKALPGSVLRVAGGWVRDKLMGIDSNDIDIALEKYTGTEAANEIIKAVSETSSVGVVKQNHEASKHLETACLKMMGFLVDLVALRSDSYADTRIPMIV